MCCHEQCLGGCDGFRQDNCFACKYLQYQQDCVKECPPGTLIVSNKIINYHNIIDKCFSFSLKIDAVLRNLNVIICHGLETLLVD